MVGLKSQIPLLAFVPIFCCLDIQTDTLRIRKNLLVRYKKKKGVACLHDEDGSWVPRWQGDDRRAGGVIPAGNTWPNPSRPSGRYPRLGDPCDLAARWGGCLRDLLPDCPNSRITPKQARVCARSVSGVRAALEFQMPSPRGVPRFPGEAGLTGPVTSLASNLVHWPSCSPHGGQESPRPHWVKRVLCLWLPPFTGSNPVARGKIGKKRYHGGLRPAVSGEDGPP